MRTAYHSRSDFSKVFSGKITPSTKIGDLWVSLGQIKLTSHKNKQHRIILQQWLGLRMMQSALMEPEEISQPLQPQPQSRACQQKVDHYHAHLSTVVFTFVSLTLNQDDISQISIELHAS